MGKEEKEFCKRLAESFSDLREIFDEHVSFNNELLPHLFMGDVTRCVVAGAPQTTDIVQFIEDAFETGQAGVDELIGVSFVENIDEFADLERALAGVRGNKLREEWKRQDELRINGNWNNP